MTPKEIRRKRRKRKKKERKKEKRKKEKERDRMRIWPIVDRVKFRVKLELRKPIFLFKLRKRFSKHLFTTTCLSALCMGASKSCVNVQ
jgi:hypothetical protein